MAVTYKLIETVTVGSGGAASIEFSSIPQTYTDLKVVYSLRSTNSSVILDIQFNGLSINKTLPSKKGISAGGTGFCFMLLVT